MVSVVLLGASSALQSTVVALRAGILGFSDTTIGLIISAYFMGFIAGSFLVVGLVRSVGYVRTFAALAALAAAAVLAHTIVELPVAWFIFRAVHGFALAGVLVVVESWLNGCSSTYNRGRVLSVYSLVYLAAMGGGQPLLGVFSVSGFEIFAVVSMLMSLSLIPISLVQVTGTPEVDREAVRPGRTFRRSPLAAIGVFVSGATAEALWGLAPRYAQQIELSEAAIGSFMLTVSVGALALQWPLGWFSDRYDRRYAILISAGAAAVAAAVFAGSGAGPHVFALAFLLGAFVMPLYSLCIALMNDELTAGEMVGAASALVLFYGIGSAIGPYMASLAMAAFGRGGLFLFLSLVLGAFFLYSLARLQLVPRLPRRHQERYHSYPHTTFAAFDLLRKRAVRRGRASDTDTG
jgi:MFS family permease